MGFRLFVLLMALLVMQAAACAAIAPPEAGPRPTVALSPAVLPSTLPPGHVIGLQSYINPFHAGCIWPSAIYMCISLLFMLFKDRYTHRPQADTHIYMYSLDFVCVYPHARCIQLYVLHVHVRVIYSFPYLYTEEHGQRRVADQLEGLRSSNFAGMAAGQRVFL